MSVFLLRSDSVARCPRHIPDPAHYGPDGSCRCADPVQLTLSQKYALALDFRCPICDVTPGSPCLHQNSSRKIRRLKYPHPERIRLVDPDFTGNNYRKYKDYRIRRIAGKEWEQSDQRNKVIVAAVQRKSQRKQGLSWLPAPWDLTRVTIITTALSLTSGRGGGMADDLTPEQKEHFRREIFRVRPDAPCDDCGGFHLRACRRIKSQEWVGQGSGVGNRIRVEYWPDGQYDDSETVYPEDIWDDD